MLLYQNRHFSFTITYEHFIGGATVSDWFMSTNYFVKFIGAIREKIREDYKIINRSYKQYDKYVRTEFNH